jgi:uncharacterized protein (TIGR00251 family)
MKISIKVHPKSKKTQVLEKAVGQYEVWVKEPPDKGKANEALIKALSEHLGVARSRLNISSGHSSRNKIVEFEM